MLKKFSVAILLGITLIFGTVFSAHAEEGEKTTEDIAYEYYDAIFQAAGSLDEADRERVRKIANAAWNIEKNDILSDDYNGTIADAVKLIKKATYEGYEIDEIYGFFFLDRNANLFNLMWQGRFRIKAQTYGMDEGDAITALFGNGAFFTSSTKAINDNAANVNILTWENDPASTALHKGQISTILTIFDTGFKDFTSVIIGLSIALALAFGGANIVSLSMEGNVSGDALTREFFKLLLGIWLMCNYKYFAYLLIRLGTLLTETVQQVGIVGAKQTASYQTTIAFWESLTELLGQISSPNAMTADVAMGQLAIANSASAGSTNTLINLISHAGGTTIFNFVTSLIVYAVAIEIGIRFLFTPLAIADLYSERMRSSGINWLKKLLAVSLQGAIIFLMIYGAEKLKASTGINSTAINLCTIGLLVSSKFLANEIVGAH